LADWQESLQYGQQTQQTPLKNGINAIGKKILR